MSNSVRPHRWQPTRLLYPWDSPGKNTGVGCHFLLQCMKVKSESEVAQSCPTLSDPIDCSLPGSSVHRIFQARVLEWGATAFSECKEYLPPNSHQFLITFLLLKSKISIIQNNKGKHLTSTMDISDTQRTSLREKNDVSDIHQIFKDYGGFKVMDIRNSD